MKERIFPSDGPPPVGPYSPGIKANGFIFLSGQIPLDPASGQLFEGSIEDQVHLIMKNISLLLETGGSSLEKVVKTTIFLADLANFQAVNGAYGGYFADVPPARSTVQAAALPMGVDVEIEVIALE